MSVQDLERLITAFQATVPTVEALIKNASQIIEQNQIFRAKLDEQALLSLIDKDIVQTLHEQKMINKSLAYMLMADPELVDAILKTAHKNKDKELIAYWFKKKNP